MKFLILIGLLFVQPFSSDAESAAPDTVDLAYCYMRVESVYPTADKIELQQKITELNRAIANSGNYPDITLSGMVSYQSDVTELNFTPPGGSAPYFSKDHYKLSLDLNQPIYNGGLIRSKVSLEEAKGAQEIHSVEVQLHQLREQVNQVYFSTLLLQRRVESISILMENLRTQLESVRSRVRNGVLLSSQASILEAELMKAEQDSIQIQAEVEGALVVLGILIDEDLSTGTILRVPEPNVPVTRSLTQSRPEYQLFSSTQRLLVNRLSIADSKKVPTLSAFATTAYGRPGLDMFNDDLQAYYVVGLRVRWNFWNAFNAGREQQVLRLEQQKVMADREAFTRQLESSLSRLEEKMKALREVIQRDEIIINLSNQVVEESSSQLDQGVITATDYMQELNRLHQARLNREIHEVQLAQARTDYQTKLGEPIE